MRASECLTAEAVIVAVRDNGSVDLEFTPAAGCAGCAGTCLWKRLQASRIEKISARGDVTVGSRVEVGLPERRVLQMSMLLHGLPLAAILLGASAGAALSGADSGTLAGALAGLVVAVAAFRPLARRLERATLAHLDIKSGA